MRVPGRPGLRRPATTRGAGGCLLVGRGGRRRRRHHRHNLPAGRGAGRGHTHRRLLQAGEYILAISPIPTSLNFLYFKRETKYMENFLKTKCLT